jgi:UDP-N-acetylmuramoylalanine--D-glutamate ligase
MKPTFFGYGLTTKAIASKLGGGCVFFDDNCKESYVDNDDNTINPSDMFEPSKSSLEVTTPSLPPKHPLIQKAKNLLSEYDYLLSSREEVVGSSDLVSSSGKIHKTSSHSSLLPTNSYLLTPTSSLKKPFSIWISGTNGKTTTTQMVTHLLSKRGAVSGGNIGTPLAKLDFDAPIWVLETSSFTLHHTRLASPDIYILLPITPDHLNWHGDMASYTQDKLKPLTTMKEGELALIPKGLDIPKSDAYIVEYDSNKFLASYFDIDISSLDFKGAFLQDALLSLAITRVLFDEVDYRLMNSFIRDEHRQEELTDTQGRLWINDSKATNIDATIQAIKTYDDKKLHLILGGDDKGVALDELFGLLQNIDVEIYTIGSNTQRLMNLASKYHIQSHKCDILANAISDIDQSHTVESIALLSPAAASLDQYSSYKARGNEFKDLVQNLV